jgi:amidase
VAERFEWSATITEQQGYEAEHYRARYRRMIDDLLGMDGVMVVPTMPGPAPLIASDLAQTEDYRNRSLRLLCIAGLAGLPQITIPIVAGPPTLGLSLIGPRGSDQALIRLAGQCFAS